MSVENDYSKKELFMFKTYLVLVTDLSAQVLKSIQSSKSQPHGGRIFFTQAERFFSPRFLSQIMKGTRSSFARASGSS